MRPFTTSALFIIIFNVADACMRVEPVTPGMPATPCKKCPPIPLAPVLNGNFKFDKDGELDNRGACSKRTFVCKGVGATIDFGTGSVIDGTSNDPDKTENGEVTLVATCNQDESTWTIKQGNGQDKVVTGSISCKSTPLTACKTCSPLVLDPGTQGEWAHPFSPGSDQVINTRRCSTHELVCEGPRASIDFTYLVEDGKAGDPDMMKNDRIAMEATCNDAGTAWEIAGIELPLNYSPSCLLQTTPKCQRCPVIEVARVPDGSLPRKNFDVIKPDFFPDSLCHRTTFVCKGTGATIDFGMGPIVDNTPQDPDPFMGQVTIEFKCDNDGKWKTIIDNRGYDFNYPKDTIDCTARD